MTRLCGVLLDQGLACSALVSIVKEGGCLAVLIAFTCDSERAIVGQKMGHQTRLLSSVAEVCSALWSFVGGLNHILSSANGVRGTTRLRNWEFGPLGHRFGISGICVLGASESFVKHFGAGA